jgi:hypothetical protein
LDQNESKTDKENIPPSTDMNDRFSDIMFELEIEVDDSELLQTGNNSYLSYIITLFFYLLPMSQAIIIDSHISQNQTMRSTD